MKRPLTRHKAREMVSYLIFMFEQDLGFRVPSLTWSKRTSRGWYYPGDIRVGPKTRGANTVLHEFAHHLNRVRGGDNHDDQFWQCLYEVTIAWYGDPKKYAWKSEYPRGQVWWRRHKRHGT